MAEKRVGIPKTLVVFSWFTLLFNVAVILWGVVVRATNSGNGCGNHWPLCNGVVVPDLTNHVHMQIEFWHRASVGVGFIAIILQLVWTRLATRKSAPWHLARTMAAYSLLFAVIEALLGMVLVKLGYTGDNHSTGRVIVLAIHLTNTMLMLGAMALTTGLLTHNQDKAKIAVSTKEVTWLLIGMISTLVVCVSGSMAALGDTLFPIPNLAMAVQQDFLSSSPALVRLRWTHPALAMVAAAFVFWVTIRALTTTGTSFAVRKNRVFSGIVIFMLCFQFAVGLLDIIANAPVTLQVLHLFGADFFWICLVLLVAGVAAPQTERSDTAA